MMMMMMIIIIIIITTTTTKNYQPKMERESPQVCSNLIPELFDPSASFDAKTQIQCTTTRSQLSVNISSNPSCNTCRSTKWKIALLQNQCSNECWSTVRGDHEACRHEV